MIGGQLQKHDSKSLILAAESLSFVSPFVFHV